MSSSITTVTEGLKDGILVNFAICGVLGLALNSVLLAVLMPKIKKGNAHCDIKLCLFIVATDVIISFCMIFRSIFYKFPYNIIKVHPAWCKFDVLFIGQLLIYSSYSLAVMAVERFCLICFNIKLSAYIWFGLIALLWGSHFSLASICAYYNYQALTKTETYCTYLVAGYCWPAFYVNITYFYTSFITIIVCYFGIMVVKFKQCLNQLNLNVPKEKVYSELRSTLAKSIVNVLIYLLVFSGKLYVVTYEMSTGKRRSLELDQFSLILISYTGVANAFILLYMNSEVRSSLFNMLKDIKSKLFKSFRNTY